MNNEDQNQPVPPTDPAPNPDPTQSIDTTPENDSLSSVDDMPTPPVSNVEPQNPVPPPVGTQTQPVQPAAQNHTDGLGIASIIMAFVGLQLVGFILGLVGASQAKKQGRSATLSRVGWILNLVFMALITLVLVGLVFSNFSSAEAKARDTERITDVNSVHAKLEEFYNTNGYYPPEVTQTTLSTIDPEALKDPKGGSYTYTPSPEGCSECASYTISTSLEGSSTQYSGTYSKQSLNNSVDKSGLFPEALPSSKL